MVGHNRKALIRGFGLLFVAFHMAGCAAVYRAMGDDILALASALTSIVALVALIGYERAPVRSR